MTSNIEHKSYTDIDQARLFKSFAESIKLPILQMARTAELSRITGDSDMLSGLALTADSINVLIDNYLLSLRLQSEGNQLLLEPVSISAVLSDTAHRISNHANRNRCDIELHIDGRYGPVMAHPLGLQAALLGIGQILIDAQGQRSPKKRQVIKLAAHRTRYGIVAGMFTDIEGINAKTIKQAKSLYGNATQPLAQLTSTPGAGVFVADSLLAPMSSGLRAAKFQKLSGLAATFTPSQQLALV